MQQPRLSAFQPTCRLSGSHLTDRALIAVMIYTFARIGAVVSMNGRDYFSQGRHGWVRLHEKGDEEHKAPCVPKLENFLDLYHCGRHRGG